MFISSPHFTLCTCCDLTMCDTVLCVQVIMFVHVTYTTNSLAKINYLAIILQHEKTTHEKETQAFVKPLYVRSYCCQGGSGVHVILLPYIIVLFSDPWYSTHM